MLKVTFKDELYNEYILYSFDSIESIEIYIDKLKELNSIPLESNIVKIEKIEKGFLVLKDNYMQEEFLNLKKIDKKHFERENNILISDNLLHLKEGNLTEEEIQNIINGIKNY